MKTLYGLYKRLGRDAFLEAAKFYSNHVQDTIEATLTEMESRWYDASHTLTEAEKMVEDYPLDIKVAVMGCVVNGPGEAKEADLGIAGGIGEGLLIKKGEIIRKVPEAELLHVLQEELENWS